MKRILALSALAGAAMLSSQAQACQVNDWPTVNGGAVAGGVADITNTFRRYSGLCSLQASAAGDSVQTATGLAADAGTRVRFYFFNDGTASGTIFEGTDATPATAFSVATDGTTLTFNAGGADITAPLNTGWNSVQLRYSGAAASAEETTADLWVNAPVTGAPTATGAAVLATVDQMSMGLLTGTGTIQFDAAEGRRTSTTAIDDLVDCDANGNGSVTIADVIAVLNDLSGTFATGQPDCNLSGGITIGDVVATLNAL